MTLRVAGGRTWLAYGSLTLFLAAAGCTNGGAKTSIGAAPAVTATDSASPSASATLPSIVTTPSIAVPPVQQILAGLVVKQADVPAGLTVDTIPQGDQVAGQVSLDLCGANFPSEDLRVARLQVAVSNASGDGILSTEAVAYRDPAAASQALAELQAAKVHCPSTYVPSGVTGQPPILFKFGPTPSTGAAVPGVEARVFDVTTRVQTGEVDRSLVAYLVRGRLLNCRVGRARRAQKEKHAG